MTAPLRLILIGPRGAGKSTVGRLVAARLGAGFIDLDERISQAAGATVADIFTQRGEAGFRVLETELLEHALAPLGPTLREVVSVGAGVVLRESNRRLLAQRGTCVWLEAPADELLRRVSGDNPALRPALTSLSPLSEAELLQQQRGPHYAELARARVQTAGFSPEQVACAVLALLDQLAASG